MDHYRIPLVTLFFAFAMFTTTTTAQNDCKTTKHTTSGLHSKTAPPQLWPLDILHQDLTLDLTMQSTIAGHCTITAVPRTANTTSRPLDLLDLSVDSVTTSSGQLAFTQIGEVLDIELGGAFGTDDTLVVTVHYQGDPTTDPSGFGGFYTGSIMYNLGVAFTSIPHSYGRAWFPCVDNFTERNTYDFHIKTTGINRSWCNGELITETQLGGDTVVRHWRMEQTMPAYLASVAASNYVAMNDVFINSSGDAVPVELVARAIDTTAMKNSFLHLKNAFDHFEDRFGPYRWNKVGYVLTPQGAMEHATSIHYPSSIVDGSLTYENIMAHELAHHWFGDPVTCERPEEMYINEGFAEYLSYLFLEDVYGRDRYMNTVRLNHHEMLQRAHLLDGGWLTLSDIPQDLTYGEHVYNKGADVAHALRGYMGDDLFFAGLTSFLDTYAYQSVNTTQLRDHLSQSSGMDMTPFFTDWIDQPGWAAFEVDGFSVEPPIGGSYTTTVSVQQKQRGPSSPYTNVPVSVTCFDANGISWQAPEAQLVGGTQSSVVVHPPFEPTDVILNGDELISLAITQDSDTMTVPEILNTTNTDISVTVVDMPTPTLIVIQEYWVAADQEVDENFAYVVSPDRYWKIVTTLPEGAQLTGRITYDGRENVTTSFDEGLMNDFNGLTFTEDSLVVLYRPNAGMPWSLHPDQVLNTLNNATNKTGRIDLNDLQAGEYTLAWRKSAVGIASIAPDIQWNIFPNPTTDHLTLTANVDIRTGFIELVDAAGAVVRTARVTTFVIGIDISDLASGAYTVMYNADHKHLTIGTVIIKE